MSLYSVLRSKWNWRDRLRLTPQALLDLEAWSHLSRCDGRPLHPDMVPFGGTLATDASLSGWGATFAPPGDRAPLLARGFFDRSLTHINVRELQAVGLALRAFFPRPSRSLPARLRLRVDNTMTMFCIRNMSTASSQLLPHLRRLQRICLARALLLKPEYLRLVDNTVPDRLSRCKGEEDLQLHPGIFREIARTFGPRTVDRFASRANALCSRFNSLHLDVGSSGQDAFFQD